MLFLQNQINIFSKFLFSSFNEAGPQSGEQDSISPEKLGDMMSPELQEMYNKLDGLKCTEKITGDITDSLDKKLGEISGVKDDPDAQETIGYYLTMMKRNKQSLAEIDDLSAKLGISNETKSVIESSISENDKTEENLGVTEFSLEELKTITNSEFLQLPEEKRLQYVTMGNVDYKNIANGNVKELSFNFDQDGNGRDDTDLYRLTTAGQVFGKEVGSVVSEGKTYTRAGLDGEFFNGTKRLAVHTATKVEIPEIRTPEDLAILEAGVSEKLKAFEGNLDVDIAKEALERGIDPELAINQFAPVLKELGESNREVKLEELFTQVDRIRDMFDLTLDNEKLFDYLVDTNNDGHIDSFNNFKAKIENSGEVHSPGYEKYRDIVREVALRHDGIEPEDLKSLIDKENGRWNPNATAPTGSAYGLGQMINSTWLEYGKGLDRSNPEDQLEATCRYLKAIMGRQNCGVDKAKAYYNTGEGIHNISDAKAQKFANNNPAIAKYIEGPVTAKTYFEAAYEYYNDNKSSSSIG